MDTIPQIFVGIDIAKEFLDIHLYPLNKAFRVTNNKKGINKLQKTLSSHQVQQIVYESSGGYGKLLSQELILSGYKVWQVDPKRIKAFIISEGIHAKTDKIDAKMIAQFAAQKKLKYEKVRLTNDEEHLRALNKRRTDLLQIIVSENNRMKHPAQTICKERIENHIAFMKDDIRHVEIEIENLINNNENLKLKAEIITSMPGLGKISAAALITELPELGKVSNKEIAALAGVAPYIQQSGASKGSSIVKGGRIVVRNALYMASLTSIRCNPAIKAFYERLRKNGKKSKVAIVAVIRKMIIILNTMMKKGEIWVEINIV